MFHCAYTGSCYIALLLVAVFFKIHCLFYVYNFLECALWLQKQLGSPPTPPYYWLLYFTQNLHIAFLKAAKHCRRVYKTLLAKGAVGTVCRKCRAIVQHTESLSGTFLDIGGMKVNYLLPVFHVVENITDKPRSQEKGILGVEKSFAFMNNGSVLESAYIQPLNCSWIIPFPLGILPSSVHR